MALVLRIKFPPTYPLIYKTLRLDENLTVKDAISTIAETLHLPANTGNIGLYIPAEGTWLEYEKILTDYPTLSEADEVEYKDRNVKDPSDGGCCVIA